MTTNHIDQLTEWWENAEVPTRATLPKDGDRIIIRYNSEWYEIATADGDADEHELSADTRILARAPEPKPAWHDAVAVIARVDDGSQTPDTGRVGLLRDMDEPDQWVRGYCDNVYSDELFDVTPLIEAKVTDEMVERAIDRAEALGYIERVFGEIDGIDQGAIAEIITAALGLDID